MKINKNDLNTMHDIITLALCMAGTYQAPTPQVENINILANGLWHNAALHTMTKTEKKSFEDKLYSYLSDSHVTTALKNILYSVTTA